MKLHRLTLLIIFLIGFAPLHAQKASSALKLARVKYSGGGDWYNDKSSEVNLLNFINQSTNIHVDATYEFVDLASDNLFQYPLIFLTGHGNVNFSDNEVRSLRAYLENGGFLYIDDDYGLEEYIRVELKKVFPDKELVELPHSHPIFHSHFEFPDGVPKTHKHDDKAPITYGIFHGEELVVVFTVESNPSDGWADPEVHNNPPEKRRSALEFGTNIVVYALTN